MDVTAEQVGGGALLQSVLESCAGQGPITVTLQPGTYTLSAPLRLGPELSGITLQGCQEGVVLQGPPTPEDEFVHGLITIRDATSVTIRGIGLAAPQVRISPGEPSFSGLHPRNGHFLREFSRRLHVAIGISVRSSVGLTVDDCTFKLPDPGRVNSFAAGIFTTGAMDDLTITGCTFQAGRAPAAGHHSRRREPPYAARDQAVAFHNLATGERAEPPYQLAFGYLQVPTLKSDGRRQTRPHSLDGAAVEECLFHGLTVPVLVIALLGSLRVSRNTVRDAYGGFWLVSLADPRLAVIFDRIATGDANSYREISGRFGGAALLDRLFVIATAIGQVLPAAPTGGDGLKFGRILTPDARLLGLARDTFSSFCMRAKGAEELPHEIEALFEDLDDAEPETGTRATDKMSGGDRDAGLHGWRPSLRLDLDACQIDATVADSNCGAGFLAADFTAGTGSVLLHDNQIRGRFPGGETVFLGGVAESCVTGNVVANEAGHEPLRSNSLGLHPGTILPAVAITGNVFIAPPRLPKRENVPPSLDDWDLLNTVIHHIERATPSLPARPALWMVLTNTAEAGESFDLHPGEMIIGRGEGSEIQLEDQRVSHHHAILRIRDGDVTIEDLNSLNGTRVNGVDIGQETPIGPGDQIDVGGVELLVEGHH
jgi:FHA domain-containing protein